MGDARARFSARGALMRIERLDLAPYGRFADRRLTFSPHADLHVVLGRNEVGKTTTLEAIGDFLFGVRDRTTYAFAHDYKTLRIGGALRFADGAGFEARRRKGDRNTLVDAADKPVSEDRLRQALAGIDRKTFEAEFGLSQRGLREGGEALLRAGGSLAEALAAGSASLGALTSLRKTLADEADALFSARKSAGKPFYVALDAYTQAERRLREATVTADAMRAADDEARAAQANAEELRERHQENGAAIARAQRALRVGGKLNRLDTLAAELGGFADLPEMSAGALARARAAQESQRLQRAEAGRLAAEAAEDAALRAALGLDPALLAQGEAIDALREQIGAVRKAEADLPSRLGAEAQARQQLAELARRLGLDSPEALRAQTPGDAALARLRTLGARRKANARALEDAERRHGVALSTLRRAGEDETPAAGDPAPLKARLDGFADVARDAERLAQERAALAQEAQALDDARASLDPPVDDLTALARAALPERAALEAAARAEATTTEKLRSARDAFEGAKRAAATTAADVQRLEGTAGVATHADWEAARARREAAFERLGAVLAGPEDLRAERFETVRARALSADEAGAKVLADAARAAKLQAARDASAARRAEVEAAQGALAESEAALRQAVAESAALWRLSGVAAREVATMIRWRERAEALLERRARLGERRAAAAALKTRVAAAREALRGWFADAGGAPPPGEAFEEGLRAARARLDALTQAERAATEREAGRQQAARALAEWAGERDKAIAEALALAQDWAPAAAAVGLRAEAEVEEAEAALGVWAEAPLPRRELDDVAHRIATMRGDIERFERAVEATARVCAPGESGAPAREVLPRLAAALALARKADDERRRLDAAAARRAAKAASLEAEGAGVAGALGQARAALGVADDDALASALDRCDARARLAEEQARLRAELGDSGDGLDEATLRAEAAAFEASALPAEIDAAEQEQTARLNAISAAGAALKEAEDRRDALARGRDAAGAAAARVEAGQEMVDVAERWLLRRAAARLAERAVERHRAAAQDPLIARAGALFSLATAGHFAGLGVGFDEGDQPVLAARRASGASVDVKGLSEGSRDQLFLALRLALLERRPGETLPFVGDDLLASFDDERAAQTLDLLAEFGKQRQTILFTHHARVAELAQRLARNVEVLEI
jgi:chromosome segregation protein